MATQLRLVETPATPARPRRPGSRTGTRRTEAPRRGRRSVHRPDWRLDDRARRVGREGIAQARAALAQSQPPRGTPLPRAS